MDVLKICQEFESFRKFEYSIACRKERKR